MDLGRFSEAPEVTDLEKLDLVIPGAGTAHFPKFSSRRC